MPQPYAVPELIGARLLAQGLAVPVLYAADLDGVTETQQTAPAVQVLPYQLAVVDATIATAVALQETVLVVIVTRFVNQRSGQDARKLASPLLSQAAVALVGWQPSTAYTPLQIETPPAPRLGNGCGSYPLQFSTRYQLTS